MSNLIINKTPRMQATIGNNVCVFENDTLKIGVGLLGTKIFGGKEEIRDLYTFLTEVVKEMDAQEKVSPHA